MANSANNVDENTIVMLDAAGIAAGKALFEGNCVACHGTVGQGNEGLGPNLTDDYWIHGGSLGDIFKVIKYGAAEMGMRSWKDDFSPVKIAQLTSYIRSLKGSNPPNAKGPQGELYIEEAEAKPVADSTSTVKL
jgi:cytochrome c oxidase cbb3-type subunit 3